MRRGGGRRARSPPQTASARRHRRQFGRQRISALDSRRHRGFLNSQAQRMLDVGEADVGRPFHDLAISYRPADLRSRIDDAQRARAGLSASSTRPITARPRSDPPVRIDMTPLQAARGDGFATLLTFTDTTATFQLQQAWRPRRKASKRPSRNCSRRTRSWRRPTRNCNPPTRNWRPPTRSCSPPTRSWRPPTRSCAPPTKNWRRPTRNCAASRTEATSYRQYTEAILRSTNSGIIVLDA